MVRRHSFYKIRKDGGISDVDYDDFDKLMDSAMSKVDKAMGGLDKTMENMDERFKRTSKRFTKKMSNFDDRMGKKASSVNISINGSSIANKMRVFGLIIKGMFLLAGIGGLIAVWLTFSQYQTNKEYEQKSLTPPAVEEVQPKDDSFKNKKL